MSSVVRCRFSAYYEAERLALAEAQQPPERSEGGSDAEALDRLVENLLKDCRPENSGRRVDSFYTVNPNKTGESSV